MPSAILGAKMASVLLGAKMAGVLVDPAYTGLFRFIFQVADGRYIPATEIGMNTLGYRFVSYWNLAEHFNTKIIRHHSVLVSGLGR